MVWLIFIAFFVGMSLGMALPFGESPVWVFEFIGLASSTIISLLTGLLIATWASYTTIRLNTFHSIKGEILKYAKPFLDEVSFQLIDLKNDETKSKFDLCHCEIYMGICELEFEGYLSLHKNLDQIWKEFSNKKQEELKEDDIIVYLSSILAECHESKPPFYEIFIKSPLKEMKRLAFYI